MKVASSTYRCFKTPVNPSSPGVRYPVIPTLCSGVVFEFELDKGMLVGGGGGASLRTPSVQAVSKTSGSSLTLLGGGELCIEIESDIVV